MRVFANVAGRVPAALLDFLESLARLLPDHQRLRLRRVIDAIPLREEVLVQMMELVRSEWKPFVDPPAHRVVVLGPTNTGKSAVVNALVGRPVAAVSESPRTTRNATQHTGDLFTVIDTPGIDEFVGYDSSRLWLMEAASADLVLVVLDATLGLNERTVQLVSSLRQLDRPLLVVLNKMDQLQERARTLARARRLLGFDVIAVSAIQPPSTRKILAAILDGNPDIYKTLADAFPQHRPLIAGSLVSRSAMVAATLGALPLKRMAGWSVAAVQAGMLLKVARVFGHPLGLERLRELLPVLAGGLVLDGLAKRLVGPMENPAVLNVTLAGALTYGIGQGAIAYFERQAKDLATAREAVVVGYHSWMEKSSER